MHESDGNIGIVMSVNKDDLTKPEVLVYNPDIPRLEAPVLQLSADFKITKVAALSELSPDIVHYLNPRAQSNYYFDAKNSLNTCYLVNFSYLQRSSSKRM